MAGEKRVGPLYDEFVGALAAGDTGEAVDTALRIEAVEQQPASILDGFTSAVGAGEDGRAEMMLRAVSRRFDEREPEESSGRARSSLARGSPVDLDARQERRLIRHERQVAAAALDRSRLLSTAGSFLVDDAEGVEKRRAVVAAGERARVQEETAARAAADGGEITEPLTLPARPTILALQAGTQELVRGRTTTITVTLGNVGDAATEGTTLSLAPPEGITLSETTIEPGALEPRSNRTVEVTATGESTTDGTLTATLRAGTGTERSRLGLAVLAEARSLAAAADRNRDGQLSTDEVQRALVRWDEGEPMPALGRPPSTEEVRQLLVAWSEDRVV